LLETLSGQSVHADDADERAVRSIIQFGCCTHVHAANAEFGVERV